MNLAQIQMKVIRRTTQRRRNILFCNLYRRLKHQNKLYFYMIRLVLQRFCDKILTQSSTPDRRATQTIRVILHFERKYVKPKRAKKSPIVLQQFNKWTGITKTNPLLIRMGKRTFLLPITVLYLHKNKNWVTRFQLRFQHTPATQICFP